MNNLRKMTPEEYAEVNIIGTPRVPGRGVIGNQTMIQALGDKLKDIQDENTDTQNANNLEFSQAIADTYRKSEVYTKTQTDEQINEKITDIGASDMRQAVYDPQGIQKDAFNYANFTGTPPPVSHAASADYATNAGNAATANNADMVDGKHAAEFAPASHNHSAANITSGTLPVARGGTGVTSMQSLRQAMFGQNTPSPQFIPCFDTGWTNGQYTDPATIRNVWVQPTAPANPTVGALWIN